jgi:hypothetical protein
MSTIDYSGARWRKTRHSNGSGSCIEVATVTAGPARAVAVRDSKDPHGPALAFPAAGWKAFTRNLRNGAPDQA